MPTTLFAILILAAGTTGLAAQEAPPSCPGTLRPALVAELMFGRDIGNHLRVSEAAWLRFVRRQIASRFPDGFTVTDAQGQWRDRQNGKVIREPSKRVEIVLPGKADDQTRLGAIVDAYKRQFRQQSVGLILQSVCASF